MLVIYQCENIEDITKCMGTFQEKIGGIYGDFQHIVYEDLELKKYNYMYWDIDFFKDISESSPAKQISIVQMTNKLYAMTLDDVERLASTRGIKPIFKLINSDERINVEGFSKKVRGVAAERLERFMASTSALQSLKLKLRTTLIRLIESHAGLASTIELKDVESAIEEIRVIIRAYRHL